MTLTKTTNSRLKCVEGYFENKGTRVGPSRKGQKKNRNAEGAEDKCGNLPFEPFEPPSPKNQFSYIRSMLSGLGEPDKKKCFSFFLHDFAASGKVI